MEQKNELHTLKTDYPWLIAHNLDPEDDDTGEQIFYTVHDPLTHYRCRIPELVRRRIRGYFYGWMILSERYPHYIKWYLWNPVISKLIRLPRLILKDYEDDSFKCCLSSPPDDPNSVLLLMRSTKSDIVLCHCKRRKRLRRWMVISYSEQMKNIKGGGNDDDDDDDDDDDSCLTEPTCCNGNIYAWSEVSDRVLLIQIQINVVNEKQVVINLLPLVNLPWSDRIEDSIQFFLKGSGIQLFAITLCVDKGMIKPSHAYLFKLDMSSMVWTEIKDLKDTVFFVSMALADDLLYSSPPIASEFGGGYIHILGDTEEVIYSYNIKDKTISMHRLDLPFCSISVWPSEFRLPMWEDGDHGDQMVLVRSATTTDTDITRNNDNDDDDDETKNEECILNTLPFHVLEMMMKFCIGIEYLNFRATCKLCRLAAPMIQWTNERMRLQTYSLVSPWLMVIDKNQGIMTFTDPMFGDNMTYFMKASPGVLYSHKILCSRYGWLLLYIDADCVAFFNPFTSDLRKLPPPMNVLGTATFSAPPTSPDCVVVAFSSIDGILSLHRVGGEGEPSWYSVEFDDDDLPQFPTFCGEDVYTLCEGGGLEVFREIDDPDNFSWQKVADPPETTTLSKCYQVKCDQHRLLVMVEEYGKSVEVFKLHDCKQEWEKIDGLGKHMIYICDTSCVCMDAKTPEMENKIYFPRLYCENEKIVFYSLETCRFHTFNGRNVEHNILANLFETKRTVYAHAWIQPTWS